MKQYYESEVLFQLMERDGLNIPSSVPPYESEIKAYLINQVKLAYPKLTDYEAEWLLYNYTKHLPAEFPISSVSNVTNATFENVVPFAFKSAILKGSTKYRDIDTGEVLDAFEDGRNLELVSVRMPVLTTSNYKNLANDIFIDYGYINDDTIDNQKKWLISDFISIEPNVSYTTRSQGATNDGVFAIAFYDEDKTFIIKKVSNSAISPTNAKFARINVRKSDGLDITEEEKNDTILYLEKTTEVLPFESHKTNILTVNEPVELRGIGDVQDTLDCLTGEMTERIGEVVLDGSEWWDEYTSQELTNTRLFYCGVPTNSNMDTSKYTMINNRFASLDPNSGGLWNTDVVGLGNGVVVNAFRLRVLKSTANTTNELKEYLNSNPIVVQYELAENTIKTVDLSTVNEKGESTYFMPLEGTMHVSCKSETIQPTFDMSVPVEATTQNLASFINLEMEG